jgi:hypothetical protein
MLPSLMVRLWLFNQFVHVSRPIRCRWRISEFLSEENARHGRVVQRMRPHPLISGYFASSVLRRIDGVH